VSKLKELRDPASEWIPGAVEFADWRKVPWASKNVSGVYGEVRVVAAQEAVGFQIEGGGHANWLALVRGPEGVILVVPGCKIATIAYGGDVYNDEFVAVP
jgi:hypothetical protein